MSRLILIRHAQASFGSDDYDKLSPLGHQQADWLAGYFREHGLRFDRVIRGDLRRHRETAEAVLAHGLGPDPEIDPRLNEIDYDTLEHDYRLATGDGPAAGRADFLRSFPQVFGGWAEGRIGAAHESFADFETRVAAAIDDALGNEDTLVVTSGGAIGMTLRRVLGLDVQRTAEMLLMIHNASVHEFVWEDGQLRLSLFNASPHFDPAGRAHARTYI
ncbi:MAG: histidine phosphatase family protein [Rhodobacter sp.]|nr:histidine phosphatase family protein [Rhodobacter sp.]